MNRGLFITFEGIDGCGKSTQVRKVADRLRKEGVASVLTREPGGTAIGDQIRTILLSPQSSAMHTTCELLLYLASRAQHVNELILPEKKSGKVVLCDRFADATFAYQGFGRGLPAATLVALNNFATTDLQPDLTFIFDISVELSVQRLAATGKAPDRLESNSREFFQKVREGYLALAAMHPQRVVLLPGEKSVEVLTDMVVAKIMELIRL